MGNGKKREKINPHNLSGVDLSEGQKVFQQIIEKFIVKQARNIVKLIPKYTTLKKQLDDFNGAFGMFYFHKLNEVSVDCVLCEIMNYGHAEFGAYSALKGQIDEALKEIGVYMEPDNGCDWGFYPERF